MLIEEEGQICFDGERDLVALPVKLCGLGIQNVVQIANLELCHSKEITKDLTENAIIRNKEFQNNNKYTNDIKKKLKAGKISPYRPKLDSLRIPIDEKIKRSNAISNENATSDYLSVTRQYKTI